MSEPQVKIVDFQDDYASDFAQLNFEWLEKYFYIEDYDREVLTNPKKYILNEGGHIFLAMVNAKVVGVVALIKREENVYELSKMAVTQTYQGLRIGQKLMYACIHFAGQLGIKRLFLDSNRRLKPALSLYEKVGLERFPFQKILLTKDAI